jgi:hypothetical protein
MATEVLWRCHACGKWSHAKRRPSMHERYIKLDKPEPTTLYVAEVIPADSWAGSEFSDGWERPGAYRVQCGPFEEWHATKA